MKQDCDLINRLDAELRLAATGNDSVLLASEPVEKICPHHFNDRVIDALARMTLTASDIVRGLNDTEIKSIADHIARSYVLTRFRTQLTPGGLNGLLVMQAAGMQPGADKVELEARLIRRLETISSQYRLTGEALDGFLHYLAVTLPQDHRLARTRRTLDAHAQKFGDCLRACMPSGQAAASYLHRLLDFASATPDPNRAARLVHALCQGHIDASLIQANGVVRGAPAPTVLRTFQALALQDRPPQRAPKTTLRHQLRRVVDQRPVALHKIPDGWGEIALAAHKDAGRANFEIDGVRLSRSKDSFVQEWYARFPANPAGKALAAFVSRLTHQEPIKLLLDHLVADRQLLIAAKTDEGANDLHEVFVRPDGRCHVRTTHLRPSRQVADLSSGGHPAAFEAIWLYQLNYKIESDGKSPRITDLRADILMNAPPLRRAPQAS